ncbi:zwilch kinetochore protein [Musca autumnalis]|uniref:zwilch kinetochore protein n=1 Tax=Musca autumnalis TaxID=221902 RepID=UPI003CECC0CE
MLLAKKSKNYKFKKLQTPRTESLELCEKMISTSNLANIYATLLRKYDNNYMITYAASPSYINNVIGPHENAGKIVLFYIEDRSKSKPINFMSPSKLKIGKSPDDLDLTGSPLKDDCEVDAIADMSIDLNLITTNPWKLEEEYHKGIPVEKARSIICCPDFQRGPGVKDAQGSVWFLCSGTDAAKTLLLQYEFAPQQAIRGIISYMGVVPAYNVTTQSLLQQHFALIGGKGSTVKTHIENTYHVKSNISLKCSWSTASLVPSLIDLNTCEVTLTQTYRLSESSSSTEIFINQLRILATIRDDILSYKLAESADISKEPIYRCGIGIEMGELRENINKVMTEISEIDSNSGAERDIEDVIQSAKTRRLSDLTDKLWDILKRCSSYKDLKMAFNILFQCAARCNIVNTPTNKNRLAEIITEVANRRLAIPCLSGSEPLELLLEIGLEKLYKDYEYIFVESKICSANDLKNKGVAQENKENSTAVPNVRKSLRNAVLQDTAAMRKTLLHNDVKSSLNNIKNDVVGFKNSNFDEHETAKTLSKLLQIHCTLEHLLMIHIHLNISSVYYEVCDQLLRKPPRIIDSISDSLVDEMEIQLSAHYIREHLEGKDPHSRRITMKSKNKLREVKSTFYFNMENIFPPNISECFGAEDKEYSKENVYYSWLYRKITTIKT